MKLKFTRLINLIIWLVLVLKRIFAVEKLEVSGRQKHDYVKSYIMPLVRKKGLGFGEDDVDAVINGLIWFLNKLVSKGADVK